MSRDFDVTDDGIYEKSLQDFRANLVHLAERQKEENDSEKTCKSAVTFQEVWLKFSQKHQKSPTHVNNNVQKCYRIRRDHEISCPIENNENLVKHEYVNKIKIKTERSNKMDLGLLYLLKFVFHLLFILKIILLIAILVILLYCVNVLHKPTQTFVSRNTQDLIYPFMRSLRILTLPIIRYFPTFTNLYEESCLISNPFFTMDNTECWPCETIRHVPDLSGFSNFSTFYHHSGIPFLVKDVVNSTIGVEDLRQIFLKNSETFSKLVNLNLDSMLTSMEEIFESNALDAIDFRVAWKINRVTVARLFRNYFPKPYFVPISTEVSVQHFLFLDNPKSPSYLLPVTEFANVFLTQASGSRRIVLIPTENCQHKCRVVSQILHPKDVLFYNWLFWRPMSVPVESSNSESETTSVTYIGSFY